MTSVMTPPVVDVLACPTCGKDFESLKALRSHEVSHERVTCDHCGTEVNRKGLGPHRRGCGALAIRTALHDETIEVDRLTAAARSLLPAVADDLLESMARHIRTIDTPPRTGVLIVAGVDGLGPFLVSRANAGGLIDRSHEPCLVVPLGRLLAERDLIQARADERLTRTDITPRRAQP